MKERIPEFTRERLSKFIFKHEFPDLPLQPGI